MPKVLKTSTIDLLEGATEMYKLALYGIALPTGIVINNPNTKYAPIMGLLGAASELFAKACLVQAKGIEAMYKANDQNNVYRFGSEVLDDFRKLIRDNDVSISFVWKNTNSQSSEFSDQKSKLLFYMNKFELLQNLRAGGLHAGKGCSRDVAVITANDVYAFIQTLSQGKKLKAYLKNIPAPEATIRDREAIIEDLERRVKNTTNCTAQIDEIRNMFMVLPYIPEIAPDWLEKFNRVVVSPPNVSDISYLVQTLSNAHSIYLLKNRGGKEGIPVKIDSNNPSAIPIAIQDIKRTLNGEPAKFNNDVLTANTRLGEKRLDLPLEEYIMDLYSVGLSEIGILTNGIKLTAQQTWPFVVAAYSSQGIPRPCWFIIKECDEIDKLISFIKQVQPIAKGYYKKRHETLLKMLVAFRDKKSVSLCNEKDALFNKIESMASESSHITNPFTSLFLKTRTFSAPVKSFIQKFIAEGVSPGEALVDMLQLSEWKDDDKSAATALLPLCLSNFDRNAMICAYKSDRLIPYKSKIKKAIFISDIVLNGPEIQ